MSTVPTPGGGGFGCVVAILVFVGIPLVAVVVSQLLMAVGR